MGDRPEKEVEVGSVLILSECGLPEPVEVCLCTIWSPKPESVRCGVESPDGRFTVGVKGEIAVEGGPNRETVGEVEGEDAVAVA